MPVSRLLRISASCQKASMTARGGRRGSAINDARHSINDVRMSDWAVQSMTAKWLQLEHRSCINDD